MANKINILPSSVVNRVAAGEVIQRPASVVKELLENALDAGSKHIQLIIKEGGRELIHIIDDGEGMTKRDAVVCFQPHATSKIKEINDLYKLRTCGFRGEALNAISSIAHVELMTRMAEDELGTHVRVEGGEIKNQERENIPKGTQFKIKNLFFNLPARRQFLKANNIEQRYITEELQHAALSRPDVAFDYYIETRKVYALAPEKLIHRIVHLFGKNYRKQLIHCEEKTEIMTIKGYIGTPQQAKKIRGEQFFFVNNRYIRSPYLHHATKKAFDELLPPKTHPFYVLFINLPPDHIDVNVHPNKTEVKFKEEKAIYSIMISAVRKALAIHHITPSIDFEKDFLTDLIPITSSNHKINKSFNFWLF